jgi:hypothetical protein
MDPYIPPIILAAAILVVGIIALAAETKYKARRARKPATKTQDTATFDHFNGAEPDSASPYTSEPLTLAPEEPAIEHSLAFTGLPHNARDYPVLRFVSFCLRSVGWLFLILAALGVLLIFGILSATVLTVGVAFTVPILTAATVSALILGLSCVAFGELIRLFVDTALNVQRLLEAARYVAAKVAK